ncbi:hypothetical protein LRS56_12565 [Pseudomonas poae]|nr:hypothetical protein LRS56_12565 [Pseudomonas poae]
MAEMLKRQNDIVTLKVELKARGEVIFTLQWHEDHALLGVTFWQDNQASFGLSSEFPVKRPDESNLHFPAAFIEALHAHWHINGIGHQCLWVPPGPTLRHAEFPAVGTTARGSPDTRIDVARFYFPAASGKF